MGQMVEFPSNGSTCGGYLAAPSGTGPGVIVIQEWWGIVDHIKDVCDRLAAEGFVALAPDLYHGKATAEPDEAGKLLMSLNVEQAGKDMSGAYDFLVGRDEVEPKKVGSIGFCAGGTLALQIATLKPLRACAAFYPYPFTDYPDLSRVEGPVQFHIAENDAAPTVVQARELTTQLEAAGKDAELFTYADADHAFFNDTRREVYVPDAAKKAWERTLELYRTNLA